MNRRRLYLVLALLSALWPMWALAADDDGSNLQPNDHVAMWAAIVGFLMPPLIAAINRRGWSSALKGVVAFVVCLIAAAGTAYLAGDVTISSDVVTAALFVFGAAIGTYHAWYRPSGITDAIEAKTG